MPARVLLWEKPEDVAATGTDKVGCGLVRPIQFEERKKSGVQERRTFTECRVTTDSAGQAMAERFDLHATICSLGLPEVVSPYRRRLPPRVACRCWQSGLRLLAIPADFKLIVHRFSTT
jgi:hypothetical protein